jgi:hypothetical protein
MLARLIETTVKDHFDGVSVELERVYYGAHVARLAEISEEDAELEAWVHVRRSERSE